MNLVIIGRFPADTEARIRAFFPPVWRVVFAGPDLAGPGLRDAEALIPEVNTRSASKMAICSVSGSIMSKVGSSSRPTYMAE